MKFIVRKVLLVACAFHVLAFMYVVEILRKRGGREHLEHKTIVEARHDGDNLTEISSTTSSTTRPPPHRTTVRTKLAVDVMQRRIDALESILQPAIDALNKHYTGQKGSSLDEYAWEDIRIGRNRIHGDEYAMLKVLKKEFSHIATQPLVADLDEVAQHMLPHYYHYSSNNCKIGPFGHKGRNNTLKSMYNATCKPFLVETLKPLPFQYRSRGMRIWNYAGYLKDPSQVLVTYLSVAPHALVDKYGDVTTHNVTLVPERCDSSKEWSPASFKVSDIPLHKVIFSIHQKFGKEVTHNNLEDLARIAPYVPFVRDNPEILVHSSYNNVLLELLTISLKRVVHDTIRADVVYQPAGTHCSLPSMFNTQLMSFYVRNGLKNDPTSRDIVLMVRKSGMPRQYYVLYDNLLSWIKKEASLRSDQLLVVEYTDIQNEGLARTRELFNRAVMVVAIQSSPSLANLYFSQPGTAVIEGHCNQGDLLQSSLSYAAFSQVLALRYYAVVQGSNCLSDKMQPEFEKPIHFYLTNIGAFLNDREFDQELS